MAKILLGIALVVMLATAALGFLAKGNIDKLQTSLSNTKTTLTTTESKLTTTKNDLKKTTEELTAANSKIEEKDKEIVAQKTQAEELTKKVAEATTAMEAKVAEVTALNKIIDEMKIVMGTPGGETGANPALDALKAEVAKAQAEVAESKSLVDALTQQKKNVEDKLVSLEQYKKTREQTIARPGLSGRILAVNAGWNFVVLSIGDKQGSVMNATMLVVRGGTPIAKARITSVEPSTSIADIIPGSVVKGVSVQPGDTVVFEGRTSATQPAPAVAPTLPVR